MIAPLHPTHATEPEPIFWQTMLDHNRDRIVADVTAGLDWSEPTYHTEPARNSLKVHTGGKVARRHKSERRLRILNTAPILQAVTSNA